MFAAEPWNLRVQHCHFLIFVIQWKHTQMLGHLVSLAMSLYCLQECALYARVYAFWEFWPSALLVKLSTQSALDYLLKFDTWQNWASWHSGNLGINSTQINWWSSLYVYYSYYRNIIFMDTIYSWRKIVYFYCSENLFSLVIFF